jgi:hypothetical protein
MAKKKLGYGEKAARIMEMLNQGVPAKQIRRELGVSPAYIYALKKQMIHADTLELTEDMKETLHVMSQGKGKPKPGEYLVVEGMVSPQAASGLVSAPPVTGVSDPNNVNAILNERGKRYGTFWGHAQITQDLKAVMSEFCRQRNKSFDVDQLEALEMIFHKIGRILNGDPDYADSWIDIAGYAKLVADRLEGKVR